MVSLVADAGLRTPEELLAIEVRHVGRRTLLVEQRNSDGTIIAGQKVRGFYPRAIDLVEPVRRDVAEYLLAEGIRSGLLFAVATASRGAHMTGRTGPAGCGTRRVSAPASIRCRPTTSATPSRRCRSAPASPEEQIQLAREEPPGRLGDANAASAEG
jgi:hypothetical protein